MSQNHTETEIYKVYAIRYAHMPRVRSDNFLGGDPHDGPMPMDFFVWVLQSQWRTILVDTGFNKSTAQQRKRAFIQCPINGLSSLGIDANDIHDVVITHLHYDHAGNLDLLPHARFHLQADEMQYATGPDMCHAPLRHAYAVEDVVTMVRKVYQERVVFHDGNADLAPGVKLIKIGGHTKGLQAVQVQTERGSVVLASDASHYYENMSTSRPFPIVFNVADMLNGYALLRENASSEEHIIPGHDPLVMHYYPRLPSNKEIVCLHETPLKADLSR